MEAMTQQAVSLEDKITEVVIRGFPGAGVVDLGRAFGDRITGVVVWDGFKGHPHLDRQTDLWRALRRSIPGEELTAVAILMTFTPEELAAIDADD